MMVNSGWATVEELATCGPGIEGALPLIDGVNECCAGRSDSAYCVEVCSIILENGTAAGFFPECQSLLE